MTESNNTVKSHGFGLLLIPTLTVFISSACIMILELVASRLIARHLGSSLYTWTAVIGVVLAGITIGNYIGGRLGDRYRPRRALAVIFTLCSMACVLTVILNNLVGEWIWLWKLSWPTRVFSHVSLVFLLPSTLLGTISPVVAKSALDLGLQTGRTVGNIYAWGAAGSIAGTFLAGYYLIAAFGTTAIIWTVAGILLVMGLLYWLRFIPGYACLVIFIFAALLGNGSWQWTQSAGAAMALREPLADNILYIDETQYCEVYVKQLSKKPDKRAFMQDKLMHSIMIMGDIQNLQYSYAQIQAAITQRYASSDHPIRSMVIGGGGFVFPCYLADKWPESHVDAIEIDPGVTEAARQSFALSEADYPNISIYAMDARNYVDDLIWKEQQSVEKIRYDFIFEDALNDYTVPFQLVTKEFHDKIYHLLTDDGIYMIEMIDIFTIGEFIGNYLHTLKQTFPYVYAVTEADRAHAARNTFVLVGSKKELNLQSLEKEYKFKDLDLWIFSQEDMDKLLAKSNIIITDDYAPTENMLAPVVKQCAEEFLAQHYADKALGYKREGNWEKTVELFDKAAGIDTIRAVEFYNDSGVLLTEHQEINRALEMFNKALEINKQNELGVNMGATHFSIGVLLAQLNQQEKALYHLECAIEDFRKLTEEKPHSAKTHARLGDTYAMLGQFIPAAKSFSTAVDLEPYHYEYQDSLVTALEYGDDLQSAIIAAQNAIRYFIENKMDNEAEQFNRKLQILQYKQQQVN